MKATSILKTKEEIKRIKDAGRILADVLKKLESMIEEGVSTYELDRFAQSEIRKQNAIPTFLHYRPTPAYPPYPAAICASINEEVVHGIPKRDRKLKNGDIISIDCGVTYRGYIADAAITVGVGKIKEDVAKLVEVTKNSLYRAIESAIKPGKKLFHIAFTIENYVTKNGFHVIHDYGGHGVGRELHEPPFIPNEVTNGLNFILRKNLVIAVEPMVTMGSGKTKTLKDGWTVITKEKLPAAHFEHTIAVTENGCEILTPWDKDE